MRTEMPPGAGTGTTTDDVEDASPAAMRPGQRVPVIPELTATRVLGEVVGVSGEMPAIARPAVELPMDDLRLWWQPVAGNEDLELRITATSALHPRSPAPAPRCQPGAHHARRNSRRMPPAEGSPRRSPYLRSCTPGAWGTSGLVGVEPTGPWKMAFRHTPAMSLPPRHSVIWKPANPTMWYQPLDPVPPAVSQMGTRTSAVATASPGG